jgi:RNA polymerase sigma-70 factor (ECF subfamily)
MDKPVEDFKGLLSRARAGDRVALEHLVRHYERAVRLVARVRLGPALRPYLDSVDLAQSVHHSLLLGLREGKFDVSTADELVALAITIVQRKVARHWRHLRRQQRLSGESPDAGNLPQLLASLSDSAQDPAVAAELSDRLARVLSELDDTERKLIELRLAGHSTVEVARLLGLQANVLRVRLSRLRQRLRSSGALTEWL